jgi:hypothetical protein
MTPDLHNAMNAMSLLFLWPLLRCFLVQGEVGVRHDSTRELARLPLVRGVSAVHFFFL